MNQPVLFVATVYRHIYAFHMPYLHLLRNKGYDVVAVGNNDYAKEAIVAEGFACVDVPFSRNPFDPINATAFMRMCSIFEENQSIRLVHVHTPVAAFVTRMAARRIQFEGKILYTAHGFHFYDGAGMRNWLVFYPLEALAARYTDGIITINREDYGRALNFRVRSNGGTHYVPGVGVDISRYSYLGDFVREEVRQELGIGSDDPVVICVAELNENKNQIQLIRAAAISREEFPTIRLLLVGEGSSRRKLELQARDHELEDNVLFLGHRHDIPRLLTASDIASLVSVREGLPRILMEATACGLPCVCTNIRGNRDIVVDGLNGYLVSVGDYHATAQSIVRLARSEQLRSSMGASSKRVVSTFSLDSIMPMMEEIYEHYLGNDR